MGMFDVYCPLCGVCMQKFYTDTKYKNIKWTEKVTILTPCSIMHGFHDDNCDGFYTNKKGNTYIMYDEMAEFIPVHTDCQKLTRMTYDKLLPHVLLSPLALKEIKTIADKYQQQYFEVDDVTAEDIHIITSPLSKTSDGLKNAKRIKAIARKISKRTPAHPANTLKVGTRKKGIDGIYVVVENKNKVKRWKKV